MLGFFFVAFLIFVGAFYAAGYYLWSIPQQQLEASLVTRMREIRSRNTGSRESSSRSDLYRTEKKGVFEFLEDFAKWLGPARRLQSFITQANLRYRAADVLGLCIGIFIAMFFLLGFAGLSNLILRLVVSIICCSFPILWINHKRKVRLEKFEQQLPDAIDLFNRSMKAGHNMHSGLESISGEMPDPVRMEFKKLMEELALGSTIDDSLHNLGERMPLIDLKFFITGLILQRQTGANMVSVLENMSNLIRERLNLVERMKAATTQQRASAALLCSLPIVVFFGFWFLKPEYINMLMYDETGNMFFTYGICSEIVGILIIRKIASPKF